MMKALEQYLIPTMRKFVRKKEGIHYNVNADFGIAYYYKGLRNVTEKRDWLNWILYMLDAIEVTAEETKDRVLKILEAM